MISSSRTAAGQLCVTTTRPLAVPLRKLPRPAPRRNASSSSTPPPPAESTPTPDEATSRLAPLKTRLELSAVIAQQQMNSLLATLNLSARARARAFSSALAALELERKLGEVGGKINRATGYEGIERLRLGVGERGAGGSFSSLNRDSTIRLRTEKALLEVRELASAAKKVYGNAVALRAVSQREVNDLLSRKSSWSSPDVMRSVDYLHPSERRAECAVVRCRFTELVQQDHANERAEALAKEAMDKGEDAVEKGFSGASNDSSLAFESIE